jgi:dihydrofolate reductase
VKTTRNTTDAVARQEAAAPARLTVVVARARNGVIGRDGGLPWHLPDDLRRFRELTWGRPILMGRSTHESIGRALPGRRNFVLSRQPGYQGAEGVEVFADLDAALLACSAAGDERGAGSGEREEVMVIGGAALYAATLGRAERLLLTEVHAEVAGDTLLPPVDLSAFERVAEWHHPADERHAHAFTLGDWRRRPAAGPVR